MANDLGSQFLRLLFTTEAGLFLIGVFLAALIKYFWKSQLADQLRMQFNERKYIIYLLFAGIGLICWLLNINNIVSAVGITMMGIGFSTSFLDAWEDYIHPFIKNNTIKVIVMGVGVFLICFARTIEEIFGFPVLLILITGIILILGMLWSHITAFYSRLTVRYPNFSIKNAINRRGFNE